ncbi:MAG: hypothetical protein ACKV2T_16075 [Kofleriaceae bacterium]
MRLDRLRLLCCLVVLTASCGTDAGSNELSDAPAGTTELPPQGDAAVRAWISTGHYLGWACEPAPHAARPPGAHGMNRVCSNALLSGSSTGEFPVGAASVKELHNSSGITGYAVAIKVAAGTARTSWYWYEVIGTNVVVDSAGASLCTGCHDDAPRDFVFTRVE